MKCARLAALAVLPLILGPAHADTAAARPDKHGCVSVDEFQHLPYGKTKTYLEHWFDARGRSVYTNDDNSRPPHRYVALWYDFCDDTGLPDHPREDYADFGVVEIWYLRHAPTRKAYRAILRVTNDIGGRP